MDRGLLEFLYAIPREQLVRPGQRRSLMRRALKGIVPSEILDRKRKAFVSRSPRVAVASEWRSLFALSQQMLSSSMGIIDPKEFQVALDKTRNGQKIAIVVLLRTLGIEAWISNLTDRGVLDIGTQHVIEGRETAYGDLFVHQSQLRQTQKEKGGDRHDIREARSSTAG